MGAPPDRRKPNDEGDPPAGIERRTPPVPGPSSPPADAAVPRFLPRRMPVVLVLVAVALLGTGALFAVTISSLNGGVDENAATLKQIEREGQERRDQTCMIFERQAHTGVRRLEATYAYLDGLTPRQARSQINQAVLRGLRDTEADAKASLAPHYCDPASVGLPDAPAEMPGRRDFSHLLVPPGT